MPAGYDQVQHIELAQKLVQRINGLAKKEILPIPNPYHGKSFKVNSLHDVSEKMSKSCASKWGCLYLDDDDDTIRMKIERAKTDSEGRLTYTLKRPELMNLINIFSMTTGLTPEEVVVLAGKDNMGEFKRRLSKELIKLYDSK